LGRLPQTKQKTPAPNSGRGLVQEKQKNNQEGGLLIATNAMKQNTASHVPQNGLQQPPQKFTRRIGKNYYEVVVHFSNTSKENISDKVTRLIRNEVLNETAVKP